jgi:hypothetical protein
VGVSEDPRDLEFDGTIREAGSVTHQPAGFGIY